ncbi:hypothetical protein SISNIDRAFT_489606 [Sistotremastrum niveocremeum HHB9708]|uniref:Uncharacterized protein n=1 Tax=Sistotremastrum niveocremeum HHB9708 TaxID=1314777 RepID=A0A164PQP0_9AGAM|nr:hypothetical protein SISNIDRAFT_489606 [Sistotremastrum niveocremeum HHB9708]
MLHIAFLTWSIRAFDASESLSHLSFSLANAWMLIPQVAAFSVISVYESQHDCHPRIPQPRRRSCRFRLIELECGRVAAEEWDCSSTMMLHASLLLSILLNVLRLSTCRVKEQCTFPCNSPANVSGLTGTRGFY